MELLQVTEDKNMEKEGFFTTKVIIAFVVGILIGFLGTWVSMRDSAKPADDMKDNVEIADEKEKKPEDIKLSGDNAILVRDQKVGVVVNVELVTLKNDGWVVIHESDNGVLGNALGAQLFLQGVSSGTVDLLRGMEAGKTYYAVVRQDDGDRAFDLSKDLLLSDGRGDPIQVSFKAKNETSEE